MIPIAFAFILKLKFIFMAAVLELDCKSVSCALLLKEAQPAIYI